jgi:hypothetical protein
MAESDVESKFNQFKKLVYAQPEMWRAKLYSMYRSDPDVAVAAWTLILAMDNLMLDVDETASFLERLQQSS